MSEHTAGPWLRRIESHVGRSDNTTYTIFGGPTWGSNNKIIAQKVVTGGGTDEDEANARLIAAAPELLAALERMECVARIFDVELDQQPAIIEALSEARAAIAAVTAKY